MKLIGPERGYLEIDRYGLEFSYDDCEALAKTGVHTALELRGERRRLSPAAKAAELLGGSGLKDNDRAILLSRVQSLAVTRAMSFKLEDPATATDTREMLADVVNACEGSSYEISNFLFSRTEAVMQARGDNSQEARAEAILGAIRIVCATRRIPIVPQPSGPIESELDD